MNLILDAIKEPALITHIQGANNYSWLYYRDGRKLLLSKTLQYFEERLPEFIRVHKTAMVNPTYIKGFTPPPRTKMQGAIHLINDLTLPVGRRRWNQLKESISTATQDTVTVTTVPLAIPTDQQAIPQRLYIAIGDEIKAGLVEQLLIDQWSNWNLHFFSTGTSLLKALSTSRDTDLPAVILLHAGQETDLSLSALRSIKSSVRLRQIPTLLLADLGNKGLAETGYALGANSVILHSVNFTYFIQGLEKVFRYWLSTVSAPYAIRKYQSHA
ncbi:hypothetical protein GCM10028803_30690 [Larkinella knui]|uniref:LytTR family transcriptional regulator n=1 Tax=Larkinella knui TaxID=2025310 RepID=A0A3P1CYZ3_9BACT|nr:LytTR family transcriptional regulator DNA-binding domain-containing protein [Larkinella knui]RRB18094.1 LytTR family transcriptional regulator [Larkinella knui]